MQHHLPSQSVRLSLEPHHHPSALDTSTTPSIPRCLFMPRDGTADSDASPTSQASQTFLAGLDMSTGSRGHSAHATTQANEHIEAYMADYSSGAPNAYATPTSTSTITNNTSPQSSRTPRPARPPSSHRQPPSPPQYHHVRDKLDISPENNQTRKDLLREAFFADWRDDASNSDLSNPDEMQKKDPLGTQIWKLYSKTKTQLPNQERMENLTWRMMAMNLKRKEREQARYVVAPDLHCPRRCIELTRVNSQSKSRTHQRSFGHCKASRVGGSLISDTRSGCHEH